jgi:hypothetical protein
MTKEQQAKIDTIVENIKLGENCVKILERDINKAEATLKKHKEVITALEYRINQATKKAIRKEKKLVENMTYNELKHKIDTLESRLICETLGQ